MSTIHELPCEVLEHIFRHLPLATDQLKLRLVCKKWRDIIQQMRRILPRKIYSKFESQIYKRLPAAGSFDSTPFSVGCKGFAVIFYSVQEIIICGLAVFLPYGREFKQTFDNLIIEVCVSEHGVPQIGPTGQTFVEIKKTLSKKEVLDWTGTSGCPMSPGNAAKKSLQCLPGPGEIFSCTLFSMIFNFLHSKSFVSFLRALIHGWK